MDVTRCENASYIWQPWWEWRLLSEPSVLLGGWQSEKGLRCHLRWNKQSRSWINTDDIDCLFFLFPPPFLYFFRCFIRHRKVMDLNTYILFGTIWIEFQRFSGLCDLTRPVSEAEMHHGTLTPPPPHNCNRNVASLINSECDLFAWVKWRSRMSKECTTTTKRTMREKSQGKVIESLAQLKTAGTLLVYHVCRVGPRKKIEWLNWWDIIKELSWVIDGHFNVLRALILRVLLSLTVEVVPLDAIVVLFVGLGTAIITTLSTTRITTIKCITTERRTLVFRMIKCS